MRRDMMKTVEQKREKNVSIPDAYCMNSGELDQLKDMVLPDGPNGEVSFGGLFNALVTAFQYGFILGSRAQRNGALKVKL